MYTYRSKVVNALSILLLIGIAISWVDSCAAQTCTQVPILTFEGLKDNEPINSYYNGGFGNNGSGPGPNYGITFGPDALAIISELSGGTAHASGNPSGVTTAYFLSGPGVIMDVAAGFTTGFSFYYAAANTPGSVTVYDGLNGTGKILATVALPVNGSSCGPETYSCWSQTGVTFAGVAKSVNFSGSANFIGFDNITIGSATPGTIASMAQLASAGDWDTEITLANLGSTPACTSLDFFADPSGGPLRLPITFPQGGLGPTTASSVAQTINANSLLILDTTGPDSQAVSVGWADLQAAGDVKGYGVFTNSKQNWEAVVPLESDSATSYVLPFDNTGSLSTGVAIANLSTRPGSVGVGIRNDAGLGIGSEMIQIAPMGHTSFVLASKYGVTRGIRGTITFTPPAGGPIRVLGLRANGPALTTVPVLGDVGPGNGSMAHITYNGGWDTTITLVNRGTLSAQPTLSFYDDHGNPLSIPFTYPQTGGALTSSSIPLTLAAGQMLIIQTQGQKSAASISGSAVLASTGGVGGSAIFRLNSSGQEGTVSLETRNATAYVLGFDNTSGRVTGLALANSTKKDANLAITIRDDKGVILATDSIPLKANGHTQTVLTTGYPASKTKRGTVEIDGPAGFSAVGLFVSPTGNVTTLPALVK